VRRRVIALSLVAVLGLAAGVAGCAGGSSGGSGGTASASSAGLPTVTGDFGAKPTVTIPKNDPPSSLRTSVLHPGTGATVAKGQLVAVNYLGVIWKSGKVFDTSFEGGHSPASFTVGTGQVIDGFDVRGGTADGVADRRGVVVAGRQGQQVRKQAGAEPGEAALGNGSGQVTVGRAQHRGKRNGRQVQCRGGGQPARAVRGQVVVDDVAHHQRWHHPHGGCGDHGQRGEQEPGPPRPGKLAQLRP